MQHQLPDRSGKLPRSDPDQPAGLFQHSAAASRHSSGVHLGSAQRASFHHASDPRANALVLRQASKPFTLPLQG
ncbi:hypothetical protein SNOG_07053 [Parastagonospora nodorum SN15]|uniref:Uncharacterized protein n=1 Tax=Phaeosphaeria nodorum (strain SN15 / ATCC MYA-4574 / FGSC 10173) TaxID=321614 RepID=Q0UMG1_PHANO|nr:hypothetical protein SNOG_07053 [Parastagonospora nodorum SN15]EAT85704.1 hypothetical protein SNOG_07053 [Parastagonospora nodorum SN15]